MKAPLLGLVSGSFVMSGVSAQEKNSAKDENGNTFAVIVLGYGIAGVVAAYPRLDCVCSIEGEGLTGGANAV